MAIPYNGQFFTTSVFLVFCNRIVGILFALLMIAITGEEICNSAPSWKYLAISFASVAASTCQYDALKYVSFPVQMLGKSFKMMPVMLWSIAISGKWYSLQDWIIAAAVTAGVTQFLVAGSISSANKTGNSSYGLLLLVAFMCLDGFTSTFQEKLFKEHKTTKFNQMLYVNLGSTFVSLGSMMVYGSLQPALEFCKLHPELMRDAAYLSISAVSGQWFILSQVKEYGALVFAATMNVRQVVSILLSYATFGHVIKPLQIIGLVMVFAALFYKSYTGIAAHKAHKEENSLLVRAPRDAPKDEISV